MFVLIFLHLQKLLLKYSNIFKKSFSIILLITSSLTIVEAQTDTVRIDSIGFEKYNEEKLKIHSPQRAAMYSAVLPGLGQIYNRNYWKLPLVYGGLGFLGYYLVFYNEEYQRFRDAYVYRTDGNPNTIDEFDDEFSFYTKEWIASGRDFYRRKRDLSVLGLAGIYVATILDATVEGYLFNYDVSEDLSINIRPIVVEQFSAMKPGMKISIRF